MSNPKDSVSEGYKNWLYAWVERGVDRYTFPDGTTLQLTDSRVPEYFDRFEDKLQPPKHPDYIETDPLIIKQASQRKLDLLERLKS